MTRIISILLGLALALSAAAWAADDVNIGDLYCKFPYKVGGPAGQVDDYFDFACRSRLNGNPKATIILMNEPGADLDNSGKSPTAPTGTKKWLPYEVQGFACIINGQPAGRPTCCTTDTSVSIKSDGKIKFQCKCKLTEPGTSCNITDASLVTERSCAAACDPTLNR
jgi:hypothetical protein